MSGPPYDGSQVHAGPPYQVRGYTVGTPSQPGPSTGVPVTGVITEIIYSGADMYVEQDFTASSQWHLVHGLGKIPGVSVYDAAGFEIGADVQADSTSVTVTWPGPTTGKLVLS